MTSHDDSSTLADLPIGASGTVVEVRCLRPVARRLMEMGVLPGTPLVVIRRAPLGDPIVLRLRGYSLSIRRQEAAGVVLSDVREPATVRGDAPAKVQEAARDVAAAPPAERLQAAGRPVS